MEFLKFIFSQNYYGKFGFSFEIWWGAHWKIFIWCLYVPSTHIYQNQATICLAHIFSGKTSSQVQCITKTCHNFFKNFRWRRALSSKVFHWFHVAKCYSEVKNEEVSWKKLTSKLFGKLSYDIGRMFLVFLE